MQPPSLLSFSDLPDDILVYIFFFLNPSAGDDDAASAPIVEQYLIEAMRIAASAGFDAGLWGRKLDIVNKDFNKQNYLAFIQMLRAWPKQALTLALVCRRWSRILRSCENLEALWWRPSAAYVLATKTNNANPIDNRNKKFVVLKIAREAPSITAEHIRLCAASLSHEARRFQTVLTQQEAVANQEGIRYLKVFLEVQRKHTAIVRKLQREQALQIAKVHRFRPFMLNIFKPLVKTMFISIAIVGSISFVAIMTQRILVEELVWKRSFESAVLPLQIFQHVSFGILLATSFVFCALSLVLVVQNEWMNPFRRNHSSTYNTLFLLLSLAFVVQTVLVWVNSAVPKVLPGHVVIAPVLSYMVLGVFVTSFLGLRACFRRNYLVGVAVGLVVIFFCAIILFLVLVGLSLQIGIHVAYSFIPLYPFEVIGFLIAFGYTARHMRYRRKEDMLQTSLATILCAGLIVTQVMQSIWNSYGIVAVASVPLSLGLYFFAQFSLGMVDFCAFRQQLNI